MAEWWDGKWASERGSQGSEFIWKYFNGTGVKITIRTLNFERDRIEQGGAWAVQFGLHSIGFDADDWHDAIVKGCQLLRDHLAAFLIEFEKAEEMPVFATTGKQRINDVPFDV